MEGGTQDFKSHHVLAPLCNWFEEGRDLAHIRPAKDLLELLKHA